MIFLLQHLGVEKELVPLLSVSELSRPEPGLPVAGELVRKVLLLMTDIRCVCRMIKVDRQKHMKPLKGNYLLCVCDQSVVQAKRKYIGGCLQFVYTGTCNTSIKPSRILFIVSVC